MYTSLADAIRDAEASGKSLAQVALEAEARDQGRPVTEIREALGRALSVMRGAVTRGLTGDLHSASGLVGGDAAKLRQIFGADAALYVDVKQYGSVYKVLSSETIVEMHAKLVDLRTGALLWDGKATASSAEQSSTQSNPIAMLVQAVVDQIAANLADRSYQIAGMTSNRLVYAPNGLLPGPRARQPVKN